MRRTILAVVAICLWAALADSARASWWNYIHCFGGQSLHGQGNPPQRESDENSDKEQCHGKDGDLLTCEDTVNGNNFKVDCLQTPNRTTCDGFLDCGDPYDPVSCVGMDEVFAGTEGNVGYIVCYKDNTVQTKFECGPLA